MKIWHALTREERARALAETSGRGGRDTETMITTDDDRPGGIILSTTKGADAAAVLRRGVGTHIARTFYDGVPHEWCIRIPGKQFRGWGGAFRPQWDEATTKRGTGPSPWSRGADVAAFGAEDGEE